MNFTNPGDQPSPTQAPPRGPLSEARDPSVPKLASLSAIRVVSSAYLRLLIFFPAILSPACASSSPAFLMN